MSAILKETALRFRPMTDADLDEIASIERNAYPYPWTRLIFSDCLRVGYSCWVCTRDNLIEGYAVISVAAGEAHLLNLCVRPESQRQGIGRKLLVYAASLARRRDAEILLLEVRPSNHAALKLYRDMGFNEIGRRRNYYPSPDGREDAYVLGLAL
jgi:ribosomal-protein-alanine N-acetyltransferase